MHTKTKPYSSFLLNLYSVDFAFLIITSILFLDCFLLLYGQNLFTITKETYSNIGLICTFLVLYGLVFAILIPSIRYGLGLLLVVFFHKYISKKKQDRNSSFSSQFSVLKEAILENNNVKYQEYLENKEWDKRITKFNVALCAFAFLMPIELYFSDSIIGTLIRKIEPNVSCNIGCKIVIVLLFLAIFLFSIYPHQAPDIYNPKPKDNNQKAKPNFNPKY